MSKDKLTFHEDGTLDPEAKRLLDQLKAAQGRGYIALATSGLERKIRINDTDPENPFWECLIGRVWRRVV